MDTQRWARRVPLWPDAKGAQTGASCDVCTSFSSGRPMPGSQEALWGTAETACSQLAAALRTGAALDVATVRQLRAALSELDGLPASAPTVGFLR